MKELLTDANFPRTADQRVYHLGLRPGEVANRLITVGSPSRAETIAAFLDEHPKTFVLSSDRGFLTMTGRYKGIPVSIVSIGMGSPNMDFFVRESRECISGDMCIVRLGSCGALADIPVGCVVVPEASVAVSRNFDYDFLRPDKCHEPAYRVSKEAPADPTLHLHVCEALKATKPAGMKTDVFTGTVNASADSFYSSQGRSTSFPDENADLIDQLRISVPNLTTLEMETFHLYHLAACWGGGRTVLESDEPPLTGGPVRPIIPPPSVATRPESTAPPQLLGTKIRAAAAQMVFASRTTQDFITPEQVSELERWTGLAVLEALHSMEIPIERLHPEEASVWKLQPSGF